jgi:2-methylcitrate dehydratase PrpD
MTAAVPALKPARVTLTLKDGRQATRTCDSPRGDCLNPYDESEIREKFRSLAGQALTPQGLGEVERAVERLEQWDGAAELTALLRRHCRQDWRPAAALTS